MTAVGAEKKYLTPSEALELAITIREERLAYEQAKDEAAEHIRLGRIALGRAMIEARKKGATVEFILTGAQLTRTRAYLFMHMAQEEDDA
jgi:hypothetical protein